MAITRPLLVALAASIALLASVGVDLAYGQTVTLDVMDQGQWRTVGSAPIESREYPVRSTPATDEPLSAGHNDTLDLRVRLDNGYPWPSARTFQLRGDGCYDGARDLATVRVSAPGSASAEQTARVPVKSLGTSFREPKPIGDSTSNDVAVLYVCLGSRYVAEGTLVFAGGTL